MPDNYFREVIFFDILHPNYVYRKVYWWKSIIIKVATKI